MWEDDRQASFETKPALWLPFFMSEFTPWMSRGLTFGTDHNPSPSQRSLVQGFMNLGRTV